MFPAVYAAFSIVQLMLFFSVTMVRKDEATVSTWCDAHVRKKKPMSAHGMTSGTEKGTEVCEHVIIITRMLNTIARRSPGM
jgi:hypothetical protein